MNLKKHLDKCYSSAFFNIDGHLFLLTFFAVTVNQKNLASYL